MVAGSTCEANVTSQQLQAVYDKLRLGNFESLDEYICLKSKVYLLRLREHYYTCSCPQGQKNRNQCKHAILCAFKKGLLQFHEAVRDPVIRQTRRGRGRTVGAHRGGALSQR